MAPAALVLVAQDPAPGQVTPRVACQASPAFTYALYVPPGYTPDRKWPVVFGFDSQGYGERPVRFLEKPAGDFGYLLLGSHDSKNGPMEPILAAQNALWKEANARFAIDGARAYAVGFSGGARAAVRMALDHPGRFAGVICCGAFVPGDRSLPKRLPFAVYGTVGTEDFNLFEFYQADRDLTRGGTPHWIEIFHGPHRWPSADLAREGLEFMQAVAMQKGQIPTDGDFLKRVVAERLASAAALKAAGDLIPALWKYRQTALFFKGVEGADRAYAEAVALGEDPEFKARVATEEKLEVAVARLRQCTSLEDYERELPTLEKLAQGQGWAADRGRWALTIPAMDLKATGMMAHQRGNYKASAALFELACRADPSDRVAAYDAACARARLGQKKEALDWLRKAVAAGFRDRQLLATDADLNDIRKDPAFAEILQHLEAPPGG